MTRGDGSSTIAVLRIVESELRAGRAAPTGAAINRTMGWGSGATDALGRLCGWGLLNCLGRRHTARGWRYDYALTSPDERKAFLRDPDCRLPPLVRAELERRPS